MSILDDCKTFDDYKAKWVAGNKTESKSSYDSQSLMKVFKERIKKETGRVMQYFWASIVYQIIVYAVLSHVILKYWSNPQYVLLSCVGIAIFIPFTVMLLRKYKAMASVKQITPGLWTMRDHVQRKRDLLQEFFQFKKRYELFLVPLSCVLGIVLTFSIYVPGGVQQNLGLAFAVFVITIVSCIAAIWSENRRNFREPMDELQKILDDFSEGANR